MPILLTLLFSTVYLFGTGLALERRQETYSGENTMATYAANITPEKTG